MLSALDDVEMATDPKLEAELAGRKAYSDSRSAANNEPSLVVSIEADAFKLGWGDWVSHLLVRRARSLIAAGHAYGKSGADYTVDFPRTTGASCVPRCSGSNSTAGRGGGHKIEKGQ